MSFQILESMKKLKNQIDTLDNHINWWRLYYISVYFEQLKSEMYIKIFFVFMIVSTLNNIKLQKNYKWKFQVALL